MRPGVIIGIPLTLLQFGVHHHISPELAAQNFLLCNSIYDADRFTNVTALGPRFVSKTSTLLATLSYASDERLQPLAPLIPILHSGYGTLKPFIAPIKPFFVAGLWSTLVCYVPNYDTNVALTSVALFLNIAALSHAADIVDMEEDAQNGIVTPAVTLGTQGAMQYAIALQFASIIVDCVSTTPHVLYSTLSLTTLVGILTERNKEFMLLGLSFVAAYTYSNDLELIMSLLRNTEVPHRFAISSALHLTQAVMHFEEPYRSRALDLIFNIVNGGDAVGSFMLHTFEKLLRRRIG
jgi:hypothetical protein